MISTPAKQEKMRVDHYLIDQEQTELRIKTREAEQEREIRGIEIKGLINPEVRPIVCGSLTGKLQQWGKWNTEKVTIDQLPLFTISKKREIRKFKLIVDKIIESNDIYPEKPEQGKTSSGCHVELTELYYPKNNACWTFALKSLGERGKSESAIMKTLEELKLPPIDRFHVENLSYPEWLQRLIFK